MNTPKKFDRNKYDENLISNTIFSADAGVGIPFNEFADKKFTNEHAAYANIGFQFSFSFRHSFTPYIGIALKYFNTTNSFDEQKFQNDWNQSNAPITSVFKSNAYNISGFLLGLTYIFPSPKMNVETSIYTGYINGLLPASSMQFDPPLPFYQYKFVKATISDYMANNFALSLDVAFHYLLSKDFFLRASADVTICDLTFRSMTQTVIDTAGIAYSIDMQDYLQPFRLVHLKVGIGYQLR